MSAMQVFALEKEKGNWFMAAAGVLRDLSNRHICDCNQACFCDKVQKGSLQLISFPFQQKSLEKFFKYPAMEAQSPKSMQQFLTAYAKALMEYGTFLDK